MDVLKEIAEPSKRQILALLRSGPKSVSDLVAATGMKQPNVSNHLAKLRGKGLVKSQKLGRKVFYVLASAEIDELLAGLLVEDTRPSNSVVLDQELVRRFSKAATNGDEVETTRLVDLLLRQGETPIDIYQRLFAESMVLIGQWWQVKAIDVGQEHLASAIIERLMSRIILHVPPARNRPMTAILGCVQGNWHALGLRMVADILKLSGWKTFYMGANVPHESFLSGIEEHRPDVVMVSCPVEMFQPPTLELLGMLLTMRQNQPGFLIGVGGTHAAQNEAFFLEQGFDFVGHDLQDLTDRLIPKLEKQTASSSGLSNN